MPFHHTSIFKRRVKDSNLCMVISHDHRLAIWCNTNSANPPKIWRKMKDSNPHAVSSRNLGFQDQYNTNSANLPFKS